MNTQTETHCGSNTKTSDRKTCTLMGMKFTQRVVQKSVCVCGCGFVRESGNLARLAVDRSQLHVFILQHLSVPVSFLLLLTHTCTHRAAANTRPLPTHVHPCIFLWQRETGGTGRWGVVQHVMRRSHIWMVQSDSLILHQETICTWQLIPLTHLPTFAYVSRLCVFVLL